MASSVSSTILYKFRSGTNFESLPMPGTMARLFDIKRAIVRAKKLDKGGSLGGGLEFDLSVKNASTNEVYSDESMLLPRGTRVIVQRLPAARGAGLLARIARVEAGMGSVGGDPRLNAFGSNRNVDNGFYTVSSREREEDEFVTNGGGVPMAGNITNQQQTPSEQSAQGVKQADQEEGEKELAALRAVTDHAVASTSSMYRPYQSGSMSSGGPNRGPPMTMGGHGQGSLRPHPPHGRHAGRPNADPEIREQEQKQPKKTTGIPRTFLMFTQNAANADGTSGEGELLEQQNGQSTGDSAEGTSSGPRLQPNQLGFQELLSRGGGKSTKRDLDMALKITSTPIPDYLQCGICHSVVKDAMLLSWDLEGRTACDACIRPALSQDGFRCPLTGQEGVSPDDLHPNYGLRKAAEKFMKDVMDKMEEIEAQALAETQAELSSQNEMNNNGTKSNFMDPASGDNGVVSIGGGSDLSKRNKRKQQTSDDLFGDEEDFGGDVFDVEAKEESEQNDSSYETDKDKTSASGTDVSLGASAINKDSTPSEHNASIHDALMDKKRSETLLSKECDKTNVGMPSSSNGCASLPSQSSFREQRASRSPSATNGREQSQASSPRKRGPPAGYASGPAVPTVALGQPGNISGGSSIPPPPPPPPPKPYNMPPPQLNKPSFPPPPHSQGNFEHDGGGRGGGGGGFHQGRGGDRPPSSYYRGRGRGGRGGGRFPPSSYYPQKDVGGGRGTPYNGMTHPQDDMPPPNTFPPPNRNAHGGPPANRGGRGGRGKGERYQSDHWPQYHHGESTRGHGEFNRSGFDRHDDRHSERGRGGGERDFKRPRIGGGGRDERHPSHHDGDQWGGARDGHRGDFQQGHSQGGDHHFNPGRGGREGRFRGGGGSRGMGGYRGRGGRGGRGGRY